MIALLMRHEYQENNPTSVCNSRKKLRFRSIQILIDTQARKWGTGLDQICDLSFLFLHGI